MGETSLLNLAKRPFLDMQARARKFFDDRESAEPEAWKAAHPLQLPSDDVVVRFIVPLISRTKANDWEVVCRNLGHTLGSLRRQTSPRWRVTIACQTRPPGIDWDDQVRFLEFPIAPYRKGNDKQRKQRFLIRETSRQDKSDGYLFFLDADDLLHPRLVEHIVTDNNGHGYSITQGYMVDLSARQAVPLGIETARPSPVDRPFNAMCGSSSAIRFDLRRDRAHAGIAYRRGAHGNLHVHVAKFGLSLEPVPFPAALYVFNHGDNLQRHRGVEQSKLDALEASPIDPAGFEEIMRDFDVPAEICGTNS